jgi:hypothetical protein
MDRGVVQDIEVNVLELPQETREFVAPQENLPGGYGVSGGASHLQVKIATVDMVRLQELKECLQLIDRATLNVDDHFIPCKRSGTSTTFAASLHLLVGEVKRHWVGSVEALDLISKRTEFRKPRSRFRSSRPVGDE